MQRWKEEFVAYTQRKCVHIHLNGDFEHGKGSIVSNSIFPGVGNLIKRDISYLQCSIWNQIGHT